MVFASDKMMATTGDYVFVSTLYRWFNQHTTGHFIITIRFRSPIELISLRLLFSLLFFSLRSFAEFE